MIMQDGISIEELPILIKKITAQALLSQEEQTDSDPELPAASTYDNDRASAIFRECNSVSEVYTALQNIDPKQLTPAVGVKALDKLLSTRNHAGEIRSKRANGKSHTSMVIIELCNLISTSRNAEVILDGLRTVVKRSQSPAEKRNCIDSLIQVILNRICDGVTTLPEILEATVLLVSCGTQYLDTVDHFWQSITAHRVDMEKEHILKLYSVLPYFKSSQSVVLRTAAENTNRQLLSMGPEDVTYILSVLMRLSYVPQSLLHNLAKWMNLSLHIIPDKDFSTIIRCLKNLKYYDPIAAKAIEKYVRIRGANCDEDTVCTVSDYCLSFRWRNEVVLNTAADFFAKNHKDMALSAARTIVTAFGSVNLVPNNSVDFFGSLESLLQEKFNEFRPDHIVDILVSCLCLQRYLLSHVKKVFSPHFLDRMGDTLQGSELQKTHQSLKFLDSALALECRQYHGPYLPRDSTKSFKKDGRISRLRHTLHDDMERVLGGERNFRFSVIQPQMPLSEMSVIDYLIQINKQGRPIPTDTTGGIDRLLAVVVSLPEHYCIDGNYPTGLHATRLRLLRVLGYEVVELSYDTLQRLRPASRDRLQYLNKKILCRPS